VRRLLIRPGAIGDCILSFPALQHLSTGFTEVWISSAVVPLVRFAGAVRPLAASGIDMVGIGDLEMPDSVRRKLLAFDSIVSWYGSNRPEFRRALEALGVPYTFHVALPPSGYRGHAIDFFAGQVGAPEGLVPRIETKPAQARDSIILHPFSGSARKNWPLCLFRQVAAQLPSAVEWTAGPEDDLPDATRFDNLAELADWITGARLYIGNDSGITHLAAATGIPTLALFGPASMDTWTPRGPNVHIVRADALESLSVMAVLDAANRLLDSR
jgi:heptosyltransferase III